MNYLSGVLGGILGGAAGAAIWAAIVYFSGYEIGWIAWAIGGLAGGGVWLGCRRNGDGVAGFLAVLIALASIAGGKYAAVYLTVERDAAAYAAEQPSFDDDEVLISYLADDVMIEHEDAGEPLDWPEGVDPQFAFGREDYPEAAWDEAGDRWNRMSPDRQEEYREFMKTSAAQSIDEIKEMAREESFGDSFSGMDLLFFGLAVVTAFRIGSLRERRVSRVRS